MGIAFSLAEVSLASGWGGDRAVLGQGGGLGSLKLCRLKR